jgi:diguanylate cyclase (GGDEF)-like protein
MYASYTKAVDSHVEDEVLWRKEGSCFHVDYFSTPIIKDGKVEGVVVTFRDITERKRTENYRDMSNEILQIISKSGTLHDLIQSVITAFKTRTGFDAVGIRLRDADDFPYFSQSGFSNDFLLTENTLTERDTNGGMCRDKDGKVNLECTCGLVISGKTDSANSLFTKGGSFWTSDSVPLLDLPSDQDPRLNPRNQCIHQGYASFALVPIRNKDSIIGLIQFNDRRKNCFSLAAIEQIEGIAANIGDALLRIQAEEHIQHLATHDLLTDLPSMGLARDRLSLALDMARRYKKAVALMFVDLDGFKDVNDLLGHHAGDYVLKQVAQRLLSCVRETDTVARFGGDEFLIIATEINAPENAAQIAEKVIQLVSQPVIFNGQQVFVGTSIGIALFPEHGQDMDQLIKQADKAMYKVKNAGKNGFSFVNT